MCDLDSTSSTTFIFLDFASQTSTGNNVITRPLILFAFWTLGLVRSNTFFWRFNEHALSLNHKLFLKSSGSNVGITRHQPRMPSGSRLSDHCVRQGLIPRRPSLRMPEVYRKDPHTSSDTYPRLGNSSFIPWDGPCSSFFFVDDCSQFNVDCYKRLLPTCVCNLHCLHCRR